MSDLYSIIPGLQPTAQELLEAELLCKQILEAKFPELELREGTGLRDLVLRPSAMLLALINKAANYYFTQNSLSGVTDSTPTEILDSILSNWFLARNIGTRSVISARLYFARRKNVSVSSDNYFSTDNTYKFFPPESVSYSQEALSYDSYSNEYYIDVDLEAEREGLQYNLASGSLLYFANFDPYFLRAEINYLKAESIVSETNLEFVTRSKTAISTRNLINQPSIDARLREAFNYITRLVSVGMGDPEMIRDQIKAIFEDETPRTPTNVTRDSAVVTVTMPNHAYSSGQRIKLTNASPTDYNGEYNITVLNNTTFTYPITTTPGSIIQLPNIVAVNLPVYIHNGGMVDIYCSDKLAESSIQLTMDDFGQAVITGPVYELIRSSVTAGDEDDSIPISIDRNVSYVGLAGTTATVTTTTNHTYEVGDLVTITGANQNQSLQSLTSVGIVATATKPSHGYLVGNKVTITGATPTMYNGTFTITFVSTNTFRFDLIGPISSSASGQIYADVPLINGTHVVTAATSSTFAFQLPQTSVAFVYGDILVSSPVDYTIVHGNTSTKALDYINSDGKEVLVTLARHGFTQGRYVTISGCNVTGYNGAWFIKEIVNEDQFIFEVKASITASSLVGNVTYIVPWEDNGFSQRQTMTIDFGTDYANQTASFQVNYIQNLDSIQTYLDSPTNRVVCADYLAKGFNFYKLDVEISSYNETIPDVSLVETVIKKYLATLGAGENFVMTDMVSALRNSGIINIQNPPKVTYSKYTRDLAPVEIGLITDVLDPNDRTSVFLLDQVQTFAKNITTENGAYTV